MKQIIIIVLLINFIPLNISAQKRKLKKANTAFNNEAFEKAIPLYLEILDKENWKEVKVKLAESYRKTNNWRKAEAWYGQLIFLPDPKTIYVLYYAQALQANGKCDLAVEWYKEYSRLEPDDDRGILLAKACKKDESILPVMFCQGCYEIPRLKLAYEIETKEICTKDLNANNSINIKILLHKKN